MRFSERIGKTKVRQEVQFGSMDNALRNTLWNVVYFYVFAPLPKVDTSLLALSDDPPPLGGDWELFFERIWVRFFKSHLDEITYCAPELQCHFKGCFFKLEWYQVYDFIEFVVQNEAPFDREQFRNTCNRVLEEEVSAYRFVGDRIVSITEEVEVNGIEEALKAAEKRGFHGVRKHLESALGKLSDRKKPDYRNSIKESISAVESLCIVISNDPKASLGQALRLIENKVGLHAALKKGFISIYGYTSDEGGIRHAMIDDNPSDLQDAKYMLVSCSAFVNYLIMKASKAGLVS